MAGKHRNSNARKLSRRQLLAVAALAPAAGVVGATDVRGSAPAPVVEEAVAADTAVPEVIVPVVDRFRGRTPVAWGMDLPGIVHSVPTVPGRRTLALTFDACGGGAGVAVDAKLIAVLREFAVPATLFLNSRWITVNPQLMRSIIDDPLFSVQNHGTRHLPLSASGRPAYGIPGTVSVDDALAEVTGNRDSVREQFGHEMTWFRSGTAQYDDVCVDMCNASGIRIAGFTTNTDHGATASAAQVSATIRNMPDGAIGLGHMNHPGSGTADGVRAALAQMRDVNFVALK